MTKQKNKLLCFLSFFIIAIVSILAFLKFNFTIKIDIIPTDIVLEYGEEYELPEPEAILKGKFLFKGDYLVDVKTKGEINKEKIGEYEIEYNAKYLLWNKKETRKITIKDTTAPTITLKHIDNYYVLPNKEYKEEGFSAYDNYDGDITDKVERKVVNGIVYYKITDSSGNISETKREIVYKDPIAPEIKLKGDKKIELFIGDKYKETGYEATDNVDGDITKNVKVENNVNTKKAGTYKIIYSVKDAFGNETKVERTVKIKAKPAEPVKNEASNNTEVNKPENNSEANGEKIIYLTFDDGPGPHTERLLDILDKYNVKATFFVVNGKYNHLIKEEHKRGHAIAIHSATHDYKKIYSSEKAFYDDLYIMQDIIYEQTGVRTTLTRFPGGSSNTISRKYCEGIMSKLSTSLPQNGFRYFDWNVTSGDAGETTNTNTIIKYVINGIKKHDISIVLQHDIKGYSVDAVEEIIKWGLDNGYKFLSLDMTSPTMHHSVNN